MTLRDRKKSQTRDRIAAQALRLFARQGYEGTTVDQIAEAAEVGRRTFFRYFPTKEAVVFPEWERRLEQFRASLAPRGSAGLSDPGGSAGLQAVRRSLLGLAEDYAAHREQLLAQQQLIEGSAALLAAESQQDRLWEAAIAQAFGDRAGSGATARRRARLAAGVVMGAIRATLREWFRARGRTNLRTLGEEAFAMLSSGGPFSDKGEHP